jgi:hypothetical protein
VPADARSLGVIAAVNVVLLIYVVVRATPPHRTTEPEMNFDPVTVTVSARLPAGAREGEIEVAPGTGFCVLDEEEEDEPPPQLVSTSAKALMQPIASSRRNRFLSSRRLFPYCCMTFSFIIFSDKTRRFW